MQLALLPQLLWYWSSFANCQFKWLASLGSNLSLLLTPHVSLPISFILTFQSFTDMLIIPKSWSLFHSFHTYISNCLLDRVTGVPPRHQMLHTLYIQHQIYHRYLLFCFLLSSFSWSVPSPSAQLPSQGLGRFNIHLPPELHFQLVTSPEIFILKISPFYHSLCQYLSLASLYIILRLLK